MSGDQVGIFIVGMGMTAGCCVMLWRALRLPKPPKCVCLGCNPPLTKGMVQGKGTPPTNANPPPKPTPAPKFGDTPPDYDG